MSKTEAQTRAELIDQQLGQSGWNVKDPNLLDELHKKEWVEFGPQNEAVSVTRYREMVESLNLLKNVIIEREKIEKKDLINAPFTVIHPQGIRGVFSPAEINDILQLTAHLAS